MLLGFLVAIPVLVALAWVVVLAISRRDKTAAGHTNGEAEKVEELGRGIDDLRVRLESMEATLRELADDR